MRTDLSPNSHVEHFRSWLDEKNATELLRTLCSELDFEQHNVSLFGKSIPQPRLIAWCGAVPYTYSGLTLPPKVVPACLHEVLARICNAARTPFNHLLLNLYRNGSDSMGYHADNERELGTDPVVATLSLGATRRFVVKARRGKQALDLALANGDLLIMGGQCQREFVHALPKQPSVEHERLSITFRLVHVGSKLERKL